MFTFTADPNLSKAENYQHLADAADALTTGETDIIANMANVAALMAAYIPGVNWAGFYRIIGGDLVLGPFAGRPACVRIPIGQGVCGTAAQSGTVQLVKDVRAFPGHIACDAASRSELVVPVYRGDMICAVIDLDSPHLAHFSAEDATGIEALAGRISGRI